MAHSFDLLAALPAGLRAAAMAGVGSRSELLNLLGDVKARVQDKIGIVDFPMPQFILIGKQSVGKSRLIEALAGETFNFISGTLGSRRPTILEFRNVAGTKASKWFVRDRASGHWNEHEIGRVMQLVGDAHEELGETVSADPICVRVQSPACVDMQIVDLPGFRDFALDSSKQELCNRIEELVMQFMRDPRNVMLCVEQCGDAATMSTLGKCRKIDPKFQRTILVRTKLDKYYTDLTKDNVNQWVDGFGDLPENLVRFALTLPWWQDGEVCPADSFVKLRDDMNQKDVKEMRDRMLKPQYLETIGFQSFANFMEKKIEHMFADAINPVLDKLKDLKAKWTSKEQSLVTEHEETDSEAEVAGGCVEEATTREADKAGGTSTTSSPRLSALRTKRSHRAMSQISGADLAGGSPATKSTSADAGAGIGLGHFMGSELEAPKRARMGAIASAAAEQWGLDLENLELWAEHRRLPGVGLADLLDYRRDHPEEDLSAGGSCFHPRLSTSIAKSHLQHKETEWILSTTRECGTSFAQALRHVMEGIPNLMTGRMKLDAELRSFHDHHLKVGSDHFVMLPSEDFRDLDDYIEYLTNEIQVGASDAEVNGGAQFRRVMSEVEIFLRFSEIAVETKKRDVIQARGVSMSSLTWRDVVVKLLSNEAHLPLQRRVQYVGERIKWFFQIQKEAVIDFMASLEGNPSATMYSSLLWKNVKLIKQNEMIKHLVFSTYDQACQRQLNQFIELFDNMLTSTFANPWVFLKGATYGGYAEEEDADAALPSIDDTKERIPKEIQSRSGIESTLSKWLLEIPTESHQIDEAVDKVQMLVLKTYSFIRSQVCDQVELFAESFFKLPMLRRLEEDMNKISLSDADKTNYKARRERLEGEVTKVRENLKEVSECIERLQGFKLKCNAQRAH
ncbi:DRP5A [Symbiodinium sp. CCMP2592]|nr:DRP5A [Symbiodinium sp. CCMP2592]